MKVRNGFVSNSSSSSFTCDVCDHTFAGYDVSVSDFDLIFCENDHLMCRNHIEGKLASNDEVPETRCPICRMENIMEHDVLEYLLKKHDVTLGMVKQEIRRKFKTHRDLQEYLAQT